MSDTAICSRGLGKKYRISQGARPKYDTIRESLVRVLRTPIRFARNDRRDQVDSADNYIWALQDVSFEISHGEVVGIIGRNGAGKSTLLKVLSRITEPTRGRVEIDGRVGSLLEVGTGFHPELTGRENLYLNGAILGMRKAEIRRKMDEIVAFSELEKFLDTPVKFYSSGMYVRLAFAVAAHLEPDVLLVDEVLAVGDIAFQRKCLGKMGEVAREGRTVLFVSHNMGAVRSLCKSAMLLEEGSMVSFGQVDAVIQGYMNANEPAVEKSVGYQRPRKDCTFRLRIENIRVTPPDSFGSPLKIAIEYSVNEPVERFSVEWFIRDVYGQRILSGLSVLGENAWFTPSKEGRGEIRCTMQEWRLRGGLYSISAMLTIPLTECMDYVEDAMRFIVGDMTPGKAGFVFTEQYGVLMPEVHWDCEDGTGIVVMK